MPIVASIIVWDSAQKDGRRHVRERHTDHVGVHQFVDYKAEAGADVQAAMLARVSQIEAGLAEAEHNANISRAYDQNNPVFVHTTATQFRSRVREAFRNATSWQLALLGKFIHSLNLTDTQLKNIFGVSDAQLPALKTKLSNLATKYDKIVAEVGQ